MRKLIVFALILASTPISAMIEGLYEVENACQQNCDKTYGSSVTKQEACVMGCRYKLFNSDCDEECQQSFPNEKDNANSCLFGCKFTSAHQPATQNAVVAIDPVPQTQESSSSSSVDDRPASVILIKIRPRPTLEMPPPDVISIDPIQMFQDILHRFQDKAMEIRDSVRAPIDEPIVDLSQYNHGDLPSANVEESVPARKDSSSESSESSEENLEQKSLIKEIEKIVNEQNKNIQQYGEQIQDLRGKVRSTISMVQESWNRLFQNQSRFTVWVFIFVLFSSSLILWYMLVSLCYRRPSVNGLSIRGQELIFHPYSYDAYEKEKIQPDDEMYQVTEPLAIKLKLSSI